VVPLGALTRRTLLLHTSQLLPWHLLLLLLLLLDAPC
jgi:hypothetical protein